MSYRGALILPLHRTSIGESNIMANEVLTIEWATNLRKIDGCKGQATMIKGAAQVLMISTTRWQDRASLSAMKGGNK